jgi:DNA end-binding protein Ku
MPRALWTGSITFGLVNVPVRLYSAVSEHKLQFHFVHRKDDSPIGYQKICKLEEKPVPDKEIVKAFEYRKDEYVYMTDEDFQAARVEGYKTIDITDFVPYEQIDPIYFAHTYYLGPQDGSEKVYSLLVQAMERSELAAIAKFVMRDRQYLGALRVREGTITLEQLYFADEIRPVEDVRPKRQRVAKGELEMAQQLIDAFAGDWEPESTAIPTATPFAPSSRPSARARRCTSRRRPRKSGRPTCWRPCVRASRRRSAASGGRHAAARTARAGTSWRSCRRASSRSAPATPTSRGARR